MRRDANPRGPSQKYPDSASLITGDPKSVDQSHQNSDLNSSIFAQHHNLGSTPNQASPGDHIHDGSNSKLLQDVNFSGLLIGPNSCGQVLVSFTTLTSFTQVVTFPVAFAVAPTVTVNIATGAGNTARWGARAITVTAANFTLFVFADSGGAAQTWAAVPIMWQAIGLG
jgi:hypothetical protein